MDTPHEREGGPWTREGRIPSRQDGQSALPISGPLPDSRRIEGQNTAIRDNRPVPVGNPLVPVPSPAVDQASGEVSEALSSRELTLNLTNHNKQLH